MYWLWLLLLTTACKSYRGSELKELETLPIVAKEVGEAPLAFLVDPPPDSNADRLDVGVAGKNAIGYRYALVTTRLAEHRELAQAIFEQPQLMGKLLQDHGERLFARIADDPQVMQKIRKVGMRIIANKNFVNRIIQADGVDLAQLTTQVTTLISDIEKLRKGQGSRAKIISQLQAISANRKLMSAIASAVIVEGDFFAKILREERIITDILANDEFVNELLKHQSWQLLHQLVAIPLVVEKIQQTIISLLADQTRLATLLQSAPAIGTVNQLLNNSKRLIEQLLAGGNIDLLKNKIVSDLKKLAEHKGLMAMLFQTVVGDLMLTPPRGDPCREADYSGVVSLDRRIIIEHLGEEGIRALCVKGEGEDGRQQPQPTTHSWEKTVIPSLLLDGELPTSVFKKRRLEVSVSASDDSLIGYRYQVFSDEGNCPHTVDSYPSKLYPFTTMIDEQITTEGLKILCVFGVDENNALASLIVSHSWYQLFVSESTLPLPNVERGGQPRYDIDTGGRDNHWYPGDDTVHRASITNAGGGTLSWKVTVDGAIDWLEVRKASGSWVAVRTQTDAEAQLGFISGSVPSGESQKLEMRLVDRDKMNYGAPYYRSQWLTVKTLHSVVPVAIAVRLYVPRLKLNSRLVEMHAQILKKTVKVRNIGTGYLEWGVVALPSPLANWLTHRVEKLNRFTINNTTKKSQLQIAHSQEQGTITFTINSNTFSNSRGLEAGTYRQKFIVFSNGDATGIRQCSSEQKKLVEKAIAKLNDYPSKRFAGCQLLTVKVTVR